MTAAALWLIATIVFVVGAGLISWGVLRRARPALHAEVLIWLTGSIALLVVTFWAFALVFGHGQLPDSRQDPEWLRSVMLAAAPTAGLIGASVAVAISIRKQRTSEVADELATVRALRERFNKCAEQLAHASSAVRIAGVYALAALADDWQARGERGEAQVCIDLLCAYQRSPRLVPLDPNPESRTPEQRAETDVRVTITALIASHLRPSPDSPPPWSDYDFPLTGATFDDGVHDFSGIKVEGETTLRLVGAKFHGGAVSFREAKFQGGAINFQGAQFSGGHVSFVSALFGPADFRFDLAEFNGGSVDFDGAEFKDGRLSFFAATISDAAMVTFGDDLVPSRLHRGGIVSFMAAEFKGGRVDLRSAEFRGGSVEFSLAVMDGGKVLGPWGHGPIPDSWPPKGAP